MKTTYESIEKEQIFSLRFPPVEVLEKDCDIQQRISDLMRAQYLGNIEHSKIKIFFEDNQSKKVVETTVWAVTDTLVLLKRGAGIPIHRIYYSV